MRLFEFYGSSDDNFCVSVNGSPLEEVGCYDKPGVFRLVGSDGEGMYIVGHYTVNDIPVGCWCVGAMPLDEDERMPEWPLRPLRNAGYSTVLGIECPDDAELQMLMTVETSQEEWRCVPL